MRIGTFDRKFATPAWTSRADELGVEADAEMILASARRTARKIMAAYEEWQKQPAEGRKPLVVIMGENHNVPSHHIHHMLVIAMLSQMSRVSVTYEYAYNTVSKKFDDACTDTENPAGASARKKQAYQNIFMNSTPGAIELKALMASKTFLGINDSPFARAALFHALERRCIPFRFADIPRAKRTNGRIPDYNDPVVKETLKTIFGDETKKISTHEESIFLRNALMSDFVMNSPSTTESDIIVHIAGRRHTLGERDNPRQSMHSIIENAGHQTLTTYPHAELKRNATAADLEADGVFIIQNLPTRFAQYEPHFYTLDPAITLPAAGGIKTSAQKRANGEFVDGFNAINAEAAYVSGILECIAEKLGDELDIDVLTLEAWQDFRPFYANEMRELFLTEMESAGLEPDYARLNLIR